MDFISVLLQLPLFTEFSTRIFTFTAVVWLESHCGTFGGDGGGGRVQGESSFWV